MSGDLVHIAPLLDEVDDPGIASRFAVAADMVGEYTDGALNPRQRAALDRVERRLAES